jgi:hypothetical protein
MGTIGRIKVHDVARKLIAMIYAAIELAIDAVHDQVVIGVDAESAPIAVHYIDVRYQTRLELAIIDSEYLASGRRTRVFIDNIEAVDLDQPVIDVWIRI